MVAAAPCTDGALPALAPLPSLAPCHLPPHYTPACSLQTLRCTARVQRCMRHLAPSCNPPHLAPSAGPSTPPRPARHAKSHTPLTAAASSCRCPWAPPLPVCCRRARPATRRAAPAPPHRTQTTHPQTPRAPASPPEAARPAHPAPAGVRHGQGRGCPVGACAAARHRALLHPIPLRGIPSASTADIPLRAHATTLHEIMALHGERH